MDFFVAGCSLSWTERFNSCYLLDGHIMFDCGEGTSKNLVKKYGSKILRTVDWIFITHFHVDHLFAINQYLSQSVIYQTDFSKKLTVVGLKGLRDVLYEIFRYSSKKELVLEDYINIMEVDQNSKPISVDGYEVSFFDLHHGDYDDLGFAISDGKQVLGYTGDSEYDESLVNMAKKCDALICDVSGVENTFNHMGIAGYNELKKMFPNKKFYAVHCNEEIYDKADEYKLDLLFESTTYDFSNGKLVKVC